MIRFRNGVPLEASRQRIITSQGIGKVKYIGTGAEINSSTRDCQVSETNVATAGVPGVALKKKKPTSLAFAGVLVPSNNS